MPLCKTCKSTYKAKFLADGVCALCIDETKAGHIKVCHACSIAISDATTAAPIDGDSHSYCLKCGSTAAKQAAKVAKLTPKCVEPGCTYNAMASDGIAKLLSKKGIKAGHPGSVCGKHLYHWVLAHKPKPVSYTCNGGCGTPLPKPGICGACVTTAKPAEKHGTCAQCGGFKIANNPKAICWKCISDNEKQLAKAAKCDTCGGLYNQSYANPGPTCSWCLSVAQQKEKKAIQAKQAASCAMCGAQSGSLPLSLVVPPGCSPNWTLCATCLETYNHKQAAKEKQQKDKKAIMKALLGELPQKVKGLKVLPEAYPNSTTLPAVIFTSTEEIQQSSASMWNDPRDLFLRPCPPIPCHGFVDSRPTKTATATTRKLEAVALLENVLSKVPGSALMVCRYIPARRNAIVTPHGIVFGAGHDGATMGKDTTTIPLTPGYWEDGCSYPGIRDEDGWKAGLNDGEAPYVEVVFPETSDDPFAFTMTQLRSGPAVGGKDNVLEAMTITEIYDCDPTKEDAEAWPSKVEKMKHPGLLVFQEGGSVGCHYGANCGLKGVSYMSTRRPKVGETLKATKDVPPIPPSKHSFESGFVAGLETPLESKEAYQRAVSFLLAATHSVVALKEGTATRYIGAACAFMLRLGTAASLGEFRHYHSSGGTNWGNSKLSRQQIFRKTLNSKGSTLPKYLIHRRKLVAAQVAFARDAWGGAIGGPKWAECALATLELDTAVIDYLRGRKSETGFESVGSALHNAVNKAHNNGWWLNKFTTQSFFDNAAKGLLDVTLHGLPYFDKFSQYLGHSASKVKKLCEADSCLVFLPAKKVRERSISVAQYCWIDPNDKTRVHVQFKYTGAPGPYDRFDFSVTSEQKALLAVYEGNFTGDPTPSWNSQTRKYYPLDIFPGSNVAGVNIAGIFRPVVTLQASN